MSAWIRKQPRSARAWPTKLFPLARPPVRPTLSIRSGSGCSLMLLGERYGIGHQHRDGEWTNATRHRRIGRSDASDFHGMNVTDEDGAFAIKLLGLAQAFRCRAIGDAIHADVDARCSG